jgi:hypothetical protein
MLARLFSHRSFMPASAEPHIERGPPMGDFITIFASAAIFALLILYVPGCERV